MNIKTPSWLAALEGELTGPLCLNVQGQSMWPTLRPGDKVIVQPVKAEELRPGDWIVVHAENGLLVHRLLYFTQEGNVLTKGDGQRAPDPPWPLQAVLGRVSTLKRQGKTVPIQNDRLHERMKTLWHCTLAKIWLWLKRIGLLLFCFFLLPAMVSAAVDLVSFEATAGDDQIDLAWETASEVDMLGFYVQRSQQENDGYQRISDIIPAVGDVAGAIYDFTDPDVSQEVIYYYKLEAMETTGNSEFHGPVSACIGCPTPTATPTPTPTPTATPTSSTSTPTSTPTTTPTDTPTTDPILSTDTPTPTFTSTPKPGEPTGTPTIYVRFWADATDLNAGECTTLRWQIGDVARLELNGEGVPGGYSEERVCPCSNQSYTLRVFGHDGEYEESTIELNVSGACTPVPPGSTATPTRTPRPTRTPTPRSMPTPRPTQTPGGAQRTPSPTASPQVDATTPLVTSSPVTPTASSTVSPTLTSAADQRTPTRTSVTTGDRGSDIQGVNARSGGSQGWLVIVLIVSAGLVGAGGWGIWRAWKERRLP